MSDEEASLSRKVRELTQDLARTEFELDARTRELRVTLEQQTATSELLKVIGRSTFDLQPVFDTLAENAINLCEAHRALIFRFDGHFLKVVATHNVSPELRAFVERNPILPGRHSIAGRAAFDRRSVHFHDVRANPEVTYVGNDIEPVRTALSVPMLKDGKLLGVIMIYRHEVRPFEDNHMALIETFANQAVIAIENRRLFHETKEALEQQTATSDVLKIISRSAFDLQAVFQTLTASAAQLCAADDGTIFLRQDDVFIAQATYGLKPGFLEFSKAHPRRLTDKSLVPRVARSGKVEHIPDKLLDLDFQSTPGVGKLSDTRTMLGVPLLREGRVEGVFLLQRVHQSPFTGRQIAILQTFADQAVIAIENVRLFKQVEARTNELANSLEDLLAAQVRLVQTEKLASLGRLTAGVAHEIKNPLNFVNNFAEISVELVGEIENAINLSRTSLDPKVKAEVGEIAGMLKRNLAKVVHHGRRADSIVKNMLAHSRESGGERRKIDLNATVDEALNLAYHGARAETRGFVITLERDFDSAVGQTEVFPQEFTRVLLNLIGNGFHAANKKRQDDASATFEPTLRVSTKAYPNRVEVKVRDNGTGIADAVKARIFEPFFTTKPTGEGTGLGLSLSHDIIVTQHGGSLTVVSELGSFTEFTVTLPRASAILETTT